jgi:uncharacterized SAM-binding protein YcdF (DUF218 family)
VWVVAAICWIGFALFAWSDPRRLSVGVWLLSAVSATALGAASGVLARLTARDERLGVWIVLGTGAVLAVGTVVLVVALLGNAATMVRREGRRLPNLLSGLLGLAILAYFALVVLAATSTRAFTWLVELSFPIGYLGFGFLAYLLWSWLYQRGVRRFGTPTGAVIVLGAGLVRGQVTPLLASRLTAGRKAYERSRGAGRAPVIVVSGGQGSDEARSEAAAMAEYLVAAGVPASDVVQEDRSRTTAQNLDFTQQILAERQITGSVTVVTSNFHAFRAATLMRRSGIAGHVVGSPTAGYYWPSATIREYAALLRDNRWLNAVGLALSCVPLAVAAITQLSS